MARLRGILAFVRWFWQPELAVPLLVGAGIRLVLLPWFSDPFNFWGTHLSTSLLLQGFNPYALIASDPGFVRVNPWGYPGLYFLFTGFAHVMAGGDSFLYGIWLRVPLVLFDVGTTVVLFRIALLTGAEVRRAGIVALAFLFNPFSVLVTSVWGTNDAIPVFLTVLALHLVRRGGRRDKDWAAWALGAGAAVKIYPLLFLPVLLARTDRLVRKVRLLGIAAIVPLAASGPFLLANGPAYLSVLLSLSAGFGGDHLSPHFTLLQGYGFLAGSLHPVVIYLVAVVLLAVLSWVYRRTRRGHMAPEVAFLLVLLVAYLVAVRWAQNYVLWMVPFATLLAFLRYRGWSRWLLGLFWAPAMIHALLMNGWYPVEFAGASGLSYWALISGAPQWQPSLAVEYLAAGIQGLFIGLVVAAIVLLLKGSPGPRSRSITERPVVGRHGFGVSSPHRVVLLALVVVTGLLASLALQAPHRTAVTPQDFASVALEADGTMSLEERFRSELLSFRWVFGGTGRYVLQPGEMPGILLDTLSPSGTAFLREEVQAASLLVTLRFRVIELYGSGPLAILGDGAGWLGAVRGDSPAPPSLIYFDAAGGETHSLGVLGAGWEEVALAATADGITVRRDGAPVEVGGPTSIRHITLGHHLVTRNGGGAIEFARVTLRWSEDVPSPAPAASAILGPILVGAAATLLLAPSPKGQR